MLHQELPTIAPHPLDDRARWLLPALGGAALLSLGLIWLQFGIVPTLVLAGLAGGGAFATMTALGMRSSVGISKVTGDQGSDFGLVGAALALCEEPAAITSTDGTLLAANEAYRTRFETVPPLRLPADQEFDAIPAGCGLDGVARRCGLCRWRCDPGRSVRGGGSARRASQRSAALALSRTCSGRSPGTRDPGHFRSHRGASDAGGSACGTGRRRRSRSSGEQALRGPRYSRGTSRRQSALFRAGRGGRRRLVPSSRRRGSGRSPACGPRAGQSGRAGRDGHVPAVRRVRRHRAARPICKPCSTCCRSDWRWSIATGASSR